MKKIFTFIIILMALTACTAFQTQTVPEPAATDMPQVGMPNPASVYCTQKGTNSKFALLLMAAKTEYVFFRMAAPVTNGPIYRGECGPAAPKKPYTCHDG